MTTTTRHGPLPWNDATAARYEATKHFGRRMLAKLFTMVEEELLITKGRVTALSGEVAQLRSQLDRVQQQNEVLRRQVNAIPRTLRGAP